MKIKLTVHDMPDKEYVTLDPMPMEGPAYSGSMTKLDGVCEPAECEVLLADTMLDYIPHQSLSDAVTAWCRLLRHGGRIILGGTNSNEVARLWITKRIDPKGLNEVLYGHPVRKAGLHSLEQIEEILVSNGIKITRKTKPGLKFVIEGVRP